MPTFDQLTDFLAQRYKALEASSRTQQAIPIAMKRSKFNTNKSTIAYVTTTNSKCAYCGKDDYAIYRCTEYLKLGVEKRLQEARLHKLCLNCLRTSAHIAKQCISGSCRKCSKRHNTLLHIEQIPKQTEPSATQEKAISIPKDNEKVVATSVNHAAISQTRQVILSTATS